MGNREPSPPLLHRRPEPLGGRLGWGMGAGWTLAGVLALWVLWRNEPAGQVYYPRCFLYAATGLQCPGCGILRATHALLNGQWAAAWRLNPLWVLLVPWVGWGGIAGVLRLLGIRAWQPWMQPRVVTWVAGLLVTFGVVRNLSRTGWF
jgi:hypothetical protein